MGRVELFRDLFDLPISVGTVHNRLQAAATAADINQSQDLSGIKKVGLHDEIYQGHQPVLAGVDAASTYVSHQHRESGCAIGQRLGLALRLGGRTRIHLLL